MAERPIIFSGEMVRAILDDDDPKTQTRRIAKLPDNWHRGYTAFDNNPHGDEQFVISGQCGEKTIYCPYGQVGDLLWVREDIFIHCSFAGKTQISYQATKNGRKMFPFEIEYQRSFRTARLMPKKFARIWLEITNIIVEKVQDISHLDCVREGMKPKNDTQAALIEEKLGADDEIKERFANLWDSINAKRGFGWDTNPWVWGIEFKRIQEYP